MTPSRSPSSLPPLQRRAALWRAGALALWAWLLLRSAADGRLALLLRSGFHPLVAAAGALLLALALLQLLVGLRQRQAAQERAGRRQLLNLAATSALCLAISALPPSPSFSDLAGQRPSDQTVDSELSFVLPPSQRSLTDWVRLLRSQPDPELFVGEPVRISGFVLPVPGEPARLARLLVRCCLADATPVGLPVRWPGASPPADQWLQLQGVMALETVAGLERLVVLPERITQIPRPARPLEP